MVTSIIKGVTEELGEIVKETAKETAKQPVEAVKSIFPEIMKSANMTSMPPEEQAKKVAENKVKEDADLARLRSILHNRQQRPGQPEIQELSPFEKQKRKELADQQQKAKQLEEQRKKTLPQMSQRHKQGSAFAVRKRQQAHVEMGKTPGQ